MPKHKPKKPDIPGPLSPAQSKKRLADERQDAAKAWIEYLTQQENVRERTARLRAARLLKKGMHPAPVKRTTKAT